jgi:tetratricopeptide (TPR) repeat protein
MNDSRPSSESSPDVEDRTRMAPQVLRNRNKATRIDDRRTRHQEVGSDGALPSDPNDDATRVLVPDDVGAPRNPSIIEPPETPDRPRPSVPDETQFTEYLPTGRSGSSTGFEKAKAIANKALAGKGKILKKRFVLEEILGKGGMGVVYKARDLRKVEAEDPNPFVVAKVLSQDFKDHPDAFVVLQQEAAKSQRIAHPNIVTVHDFDRDGNTIFLTMELLEGQPLNDLIKSHENVGMPKEQVIPIFKDLCTALSYAHEHQLVHADFKPGNVFINEEGTAKVLDFGIARVASKERRKYNYDVGSLGALTPAYATIEMVQGEAPTFSDDVYALACVLYEMLAGKQPYQKKSAEAALKIGLQPKRINGLNNKEWRALSRGLSFKREERFATVDEFLQAFLPKRWSLAFKIAAAWLVVALCGLGWLGYKQNQNKQELRITIAEKLRQAQDCYNRQDYTCAIEKSLVVTNLSPGDAQATKIYTDATKAQADRRLTKRVNDLLSQANACFGENDFSCAKLKVDELLALAPDDGQAKSLQAKIVQSAHTQMVAGIILQGEECLKKKDLNCALIFLDKAQRIDAGHDLVKSLAADIRSFQQRLATKAEQRNRTIATYIEKARTCRAQGRFDCAIQQADRALEIDSNNFDAIRLKSDATLAKRQQLADRKKVRVLVQEGLECLGKGKFNCAIGKADSALDVLPNDAAALKLKKTAVEKQKELIKEIEIN